MERIDHRNHTHAKTASARALCRRNTIRWATVDAWLTVAETAYCGRVEFLDRFRVYALRMDLIETTATVFSDPIEPILYAVVASGATYLDVSALVIA